jgi:hypothetical protein
MFDGSLSAEEPHSDGSFKINHHMATKQPEQERDEEDKTAKPRQAEGKALPFVFRKY